MSELGIPDPQPLRAWLGHTARPFQPLRPGFFPSEVGRWKLCPSDEFCYRAGTGPRNVHGPGNTEALLSTVFWAYVLRADV